MAYAVLFSLAQKIDRILKDDLYRISDDGKQRIDSIHRQVIFLQEFLESFSKEANSLERRIRDAANEAEDIIEHFMYEQTWWRYKLIRSTAAGRAIVRSRDHLYDFHELKRVMEEIDSIARKVKDIQNSSRIGDVQLGDSRAAPSSSSTLALTDNNIVVGLDEDLTKIKDMLCGEPSKRRTIPIVGMGGIGKTTLAKNLYYDQLIMDRFQVRAWVTVTQVYKTQNILSNLLDYMKEFDVERSGQSSDSMEEKVHKILKARRYLIVLDDIWSTTAWDDINNLFPDDYNGSRIMLTTRLSDVASYAASNADSSSTFHAMRFMEVDQSWNLLRQKVFSDRGCPPELENTGKDITRSCRGLPLAIVLIAGVLSTINRTQASWKEIAKKVHTAVDTEDGQFEKIISLSYTHLPHHLRPCFLYIGGFPEDYEIHVSKLIKLWIAEGFVKPTEEVAEEYLEDLVKRNLALVTRRKSNGKIKSCSVHDLVRDLCKRKAQDEDFERRLSIADSDLMSLAKAYGSTIRSVICFQPSESSLSSLRKFRLLRVLDVVDANVYSLPAQVFELFLLRYLAFGCPMEIPAAISKLQNLHALIICPRKRKGFWRNSRDEVYLPLEIWRMPLLKHLVSFYDLLPNPEEAAFALENLHTLNVVKKFVCTKRILEMIPNLKKLGITFSGEIYHEDYQLHNLVHLLQLEKLKLIVKAYPLDPLMVNPVYPETLKKLTLSGWQLPWKHMEIVGSLPNLQVLKLRDYACQGDTWETTEEKFPSMEFLLIDGSDVRNWETESGHFPKLKCLVLYRCSSLSEIPDDIGEIATLEVIEVDYGNKSLVEWAKRIQEEQHDNGNDALHVRCVHYQGT